MSLSSDQTKMLTKQKLGIFDREEPSSFVPGKTHVPVCQFKVTNEIYDSLQKAAAEFAINYGPRSQKLEIRLAQLHKLSSPAVFTNSGSSANLLSYAALMSPSLAHENKRPLQPGDEALVLASSFPTTVNPIFQLGLKARFIDIDIETLNALPQTIENAITEKTRLVAIAHSLGNPFRAQEIANICRQNDMFLIEDSCDALGAKYDSLPLGHFGDFATLSFYPAHHIAAGEGGAVLSRNASFAKIAKSLRSWGRDCWCLPQRDNSCGKRFQTEWEHLPSGFDHKYVFSEMGFNLKATDLQASIALPQIESVSEQMRRRRENFDYLKTAVESSQKLSTRLRCVSETQRAEANWFGFPLICEGVDRQKLLESLHSRNIGFRMFFGGDLTKQPAYQNRSYTQYGDLRYSQRVLRDCFWIACHQHLTKPMMDFMLESLEEAVSRA